MENWDASFQNLFGLYVYGAIDDFIEMLNLSVWKIWILLKKVSENVTIEQDCDDEEEEEENEDETKNSFLKRQRLRLQKYSNKNKRLHFSQQYKWSGLFENYERIQTIRCK